MAPLSFPLCEESKSRRAVQLVNKSMCTAVHEGKEVEDTKSPERRCRQSCKKIKEVTFMVRLRVSEGMWSEW